MIIVDICDSLFYLEYGDMYLAEADLNDRGYLSTLVKTRSKCLSHLEHGDMYLEGTRYGSLVVQDVDNLFNLHL